MHASELDRFRPEAAERTNAAVALATAETRAAERVRAAQTDVAGRIHTAEGARDQALGEAATARQAATHHAKPSPTTPRQPAKNCARPAPNTARNSPLCAVSTATNSPPNATAPTPPSTPFAPSTAAKPRPCTPRSPRCVAPPSVKCPPHHRNSRRRTGAGGEAHEHEGNLMNWVENLADELKGTIRRLVKREVDMRSQIERAATTEPAEQVVAAATGPDRATDRRGGQR